CYPEGWIYERLGPDGMIALIFWGDYSYGTYDTRFMFERYVETLPQGLPRLPLLGSGLPLRAVMPVARNGLQNKEPIEILAQFNGEIRGIYNYYRLARNVS
ncbi:hypothetical protein NE659_27145, partial [Flavonifractor plautii]|nr:hypothetical protein [Flavonifractor plautii]